MVARRLGPTVAILAMVLTPASALAHGETAMTDPENGASMKKAPSSVSVTLTEPPAQGAQFTVIDACGETVSQDAEIDGEVLGADVSGGEPGKWKASYKAISSVDGHVTKDSWSFKVAGKKDCSPDAPKDDGEEPERTGGGGDEPRAGGPDEDDGSSFPVVPVALGTAGLVAVALVIRTRSAT